MELTIEDTYLNKHTSADQLIDELIPSPRLVSTTECHTKL